jgi:hypothetical protein
MDDLLFALASLRQPDARTPAVFGNERDPSRFQGAHKAIKGFRERRSSFALKIRKRLASNASALGELALIETR